MAYKRDVHRQRMIRSDRRERFRALTREEILEHCHALSLIYEAGLTIADARLGLCDAPIHVVRQIKESALEMRESDGWPVDNLLAACEERLDEKEELRANFKKALDLLREVSNGLHYGLPPENLSKRIEQFILEDVKGV